MRDSKKGISTVVAIVFLILITVVAISIFWIAILPLLKDDFHTDDAHIKLEIVTSDGYTIYDGETNTLSVQVNKGIGDTPLEAIEVYISYSNGSSETLTCYNFPMTNNALTYGFPIGSKPISVSVAAVLDGGRRTGILSKALNIPSGSLEGFDFSSCN